MSYATEIELIPWLSRIFKKYLLFSELCLSILFKILLPHSLLKKKKPLFIFFFTFFALRSHHHFLYSFFNGFIYLLL